MGTINDSRVQRNGDRPHAVSVAGLVKRYGELTAVDGISFDVEPGEIFGFLGPNGAGKTTTIKMLCTLAEPTAGSARRRRLRRRPRARRRPPQHRPGVPGPDARRLPHRPSRTCASTPSCTACPRRGCRTGCARCSRWSGCGSGGTTGCRRSPAGCAGAWRSRVGLMHSPRVLFLDEPTVGLDPQTRASIWTYIDELREREDITIFLTTHYMDEAENCDRIAIMDAGQGRRARHARPAQGERRHRPRADHDRRRRRGDRRAARPDRARRRDPRRDGHVRGGRRAAVRAPAVRRARACRSAPCRSPGRRSTTCSCPTPADDP